jgi:glycosyltransferase involved in cell wall biosynthesis
MSATPRVSIGLPVYNGERLLDQAIESLLAQTFDNFELIISDNGSTDGTSDICNSYARRDSRVRFVRSEWNVGAARNFNRTFELARGEYFRWAAHDDMCRPEFLSHCVNVLDQRADVSLCYSRAMDVDESGNQVMAHPPSSLATQDAAAERVADVLMNPSPCFEAFGLMRRSQLGRTGLIGRYTASDRTLLFEMAIQGRFHQVPHVLFLHRQHADRSVFRYRCARAMNAWFDTSRAGKFSFPTWRLLVEYRRALKQSALIGPEKVRCERHLLRWASASTRPLGREVAAGVRHVLLRGVAAVSEGASRLRHRIGQSSPLESGAESQAS